MIDRGINIDWQDSHGDNSIDVCSFVVVICLLLAGYWWQELIQLLSINDGDTALRNAEIGQQDESYCPEGDYERVKELLTEALGDSKAGDDVADSKAG